MTGPALVPRIGLTTWDRTLDTFLGPTALHTLATDYTDGVRRAGGLPVLLPPAEPEHAEVALDAVDALVVTGGQDMDPTIYGQADDGRSRNVDRRSDDWGAALVRAAHRRGLPLLGICRGIQVANVAFGGTLHQHVLGCSDAHPPNPTTTDRSHWLSRRHTVRLTTDSRLAGWWDVTERPTNSLHHQAVDAVAPGWVAVGHAEDGGVEALEWVGDDWFAVAVQWHPEKSDDPADQQLFDHLVDAAGRRIDDVRE